MDTLPDKILYPFLDQVIAIRADLRRAIPGDTRYFAKIDAALVYCIPHFVLNNIATQALCCTEPPPQQQQMHATAAAESTPHHWIIGPHSRSTLMSS